MRRVLPDLSRFDPFLKVGPVSHLIAAALLLAMVMGAIGTLRTGSWWWRILLIGSGLLWPLSDNSLQGPLLLPLTYNHGIHVGDLLAAVALFVAVFPVKRKGKARRRTVQRR